MSRQWWVYALAFSAAACKGAHAPPPSPLGTLNVWQLPLWQVECSASLASQRVCGRLPPEPCDANWHSIQPYKGHVIEDDPGASAKLKVTCASEGWGVWTDEFHRIVGLCVAYQGGRHPESVRLRDFIARHTNDRDAKRIDEFIQHASGEPSPGVWRWFEDWNMVPRPSTMGEQACFEVRLER